MSARGSITLGELRGKLMMLEIACHRCERRGRMSVAKLIEKHGVDMGLPDLWVSLAGDCPHAHSTALHNRCAIHYAPYGPLHRSAREEPAHDATERPVTRRR